MSAFCDRLITAPLPYTHTDVLCCCVPLCSLTHRTLRREQRSLSLSVSPSVTQVHGFFPLTFRVSSASGLFFTLVCSTYLLTSRVLVNVGFVQTWCLVECDSRLCLLEIFFSFLNRQLALTSFFYFTHWVSDTFLLYFIKKGSSGIKLYYKLISYTHTHTLSLSAGHFFKTICFHVNSFLISNKYNNFWSTDINCMLKITYQLKPCPFQDNPTHFQVKSRPLPG